MPPPTTTTTAFTAHSVDAAFAQSPLGLRLREMLATGKGNNARIAEYFIRNPVRASACSIDELAQLTLASAPTLSRFARALGFPGFAAMRSAMAESLQEALQPVEKLRGVVQRSPTAIQGHSVIAEGLENTLTQMQATVSSLNPALLASTAHKILSAQTVYILGFGISAHLAAILALHLQPFCRQVINVVEYGGTEVAAGRLMNIGPRDILISLSFPRYASDAVSLTRYARERCAHVIALTDSMASPLVVSAHDVLIAPAQHPVLSGGYTSALLVIEALTSCLMVQADNQVQQAQKLTEAISAYLYSEREPGA